MPQYNRSKDGKMRATVNHKISMRLTEDEYVKYTQMAERLGYKSLRDFLTLRMPHPLVMLEDDYHHIMEED